MNSDEGLAAVAAAAAEGASAPEAKKDTPKAGPDASPATPKTEEPSGPDLEKVRSEAAASERTRLMELDAIQLPGCEAIIEAAKASGAAAEATALEMVKSIRASGALDVAKAMASGAAAIPAIDDAPVNPAAADAPKPAAGTAEAWAAEFNASADLQAEFGTIEAYTAFRKAEKSGRARILGGKN